MAAARSVLILNENESVPHDRRVWQICSTLRAAGWDVAVVCPQGDGDEAAALSELDGVEIHRYRPRPSDGSALGYAREYGWALWSTLRLVRRLARTRRFDVVHACNPPDFLLLAALPLKRRGARFVFDHHDLVPELYLSRFGGAGLLHRLSLLFEQIGYRLADVVIATNESYRRAALSRGRMRPEDVFVVRNAPDISRFRAHAPDHELKRGKPHLLAYVGVMGPQDGVDYALRALDRLRKRRDDWHAVFVGDGDAWLDAQDLARELGFNGSVEFTGWAGDDEILRVLSTADVCLAPDPKSPLNDVSTMVKIVEYMAMSRAIVSFDLPESRYSAGDAALYARPNDEQEFASNVSVLLDDPGRRRAMGEAGRARIEGALSWAHSERELLAAYARALGV